MNNRLLAVLMSVILAILAVECRAEPDLDDDPHPINVSTTSVPTQVSATTGSQLGNFSDDGLYRTISGYLQIRPICVPALTSSVVTIPPALRSVPVETIIQDHPAPLVVLLLGISGQASSDSTKLCAKACADAGYHVLTFDSTFRPEMAGILNRGVSGNIWAETEAVADIINAYVTTSPHKAKFTKIGVVGMSYGGVEALILGNLQTAGKLPFKIDAIQAYSPPIDMRNTAVILDDWYNAERWKYTLIELYRRVAKYKPESGAPLSPSIMRAAIAASFQRELAPVVLKNDKQFHLGQFSEGDATLREEEAGQWGFTRFAYEMTMPWWRQRLGGNRIEELIEQTRLDNLLKNQPPCTEAMISVDDPFNTPADIQSVQSVEPKLPLTLLKSGGHLGYLTEPWVKDKLQSLFECGTK